MFHQLLRLFPFSLFGFSLADRSSASTACCDLDFPSDDDGDFLDDGFDSDSGLLPEWARWWLPRCCCSLFPFGGLLGARIVFGRFDFDLLSLLSERREYCGVRDDSAVRDGIFCERAFLFVGFGATLEATTDWCSMTDDVFRWRVTAVGESGALTSCFLSS